MEALDTDLFRSAMSRLASAVTLITTDGPAGRRGMAATAVTSITDAPPNLLVCVNKSARSNAMIKQNGAFAVNVLSEQQEELLGAFSGKSETDPFCEPDLWSSLETSAPILSDTLASLDCALDQIINIGTHSLFVGHVVAVRIGAAGRGLVHFDRAFWGVGGR
ncbi:flavin reductase [Aurantiacibacter xanthus]|uniref:Flavin reductase n=2 Tax=Aurantiacibacter xanthus TaxID=1784712 RepID=A0A3A1P2S6_9SPHN|nr:flavin reductase [Aurantiacibacter xanthus]